MSEMKQGDPMQSRVPEEAHPAHVVPVVTQVVPAVVTTTAQDDGLRQDMRQVVDLMKNLSLNMLGNAGNNRGRGRFANQPRGEGQTKNGVGQTNGRGWRQIPTC